MKHTPILLNADQEPDGPARNDGQIVAALDGGERTVEDVRRAW